MSKSIIFVMLFLLVSSCTVNNEDDSIKKILDRGVLIVGSDIPYGVMEYYDDEGKPAGVDVDLAMAIAEALGVDLEFRAVPWNNLFTSLENGEIDLAISSITISDERREKMLFSIPYYEGGQSLIYNKKFVDENIELKSNNQIVGVQAGTTGEIESKKMFSQIRTYDVVDISNVEEGIIRDLLFGDIDAIIIDKVVAIQLVSLYGEDLFIYPDQINFEDYGVAAKLNNEKLIDLVNEVILNHN